MKFTIHPIAFVKNSRNQPIDDNWGNMISEIHLAPEIPATTLTGIEEFSHLEILFYFNKVKNSDILVGKGHPRGNPDWPKTGIFGMRKKDRPNLIGTTIVELVKKEDNILYVKGLDAINDTPVIDIKPVIKGFLPTGEIKQPFWADEIMKNYWK